MLRRQLEHIIRAAGDVGNIKSLFIMGSQAILGEHPELDSSVMTSNVKVNYKLKEQYQRVILVSQEADILVPENYRVAEAIEGSIGEDSYFHHEHGYYAQAIDETTCKLPEGWRSRVIDVCNGNTNGIIGHCLETHDLVISKLVANRPKDIEYFQAVCQLNLVKKDELLNRLDMTPEISENEKERIAHVIHRELKNESPN